MDNATTELLSLEEAAQTLARMTGTEAPHKSTISRWINRGVRGVNSKNLATTF